MNSAQYFAEIQRRAAAESALLAKAEKERQVESNTSLSFKDVLQRLVWLGHR